MADEQQLAIARQGSDAWNAWRKQNESVDQDPVTQAPPPQPQTIPRVTT
jgi:hypothetical protein